MNNYLRFAILLAIFTVFYNLFEGLISIYFGLEDETLALFGFGLDSFVEVISGMGIWHMVVRIKSNANEQRDEFEIKALKITGSAFYLLAFTLLFAATYNIINASKPETTFWGLIISIISILVMGLLMYYKKKIGMLLNSDAMIADANCTRTCLQLSFVLLIASLGHEYFGINYIDAIGSIFIAVIAFREGREAFKKSMNKAICC